MKRCLLAVITFALLSLVSASQLLATDDTPVAGQSGALSEDAQLEQYFRELGILRPLRSPPLDDIRFENLNGNEILLSDFKGKVVFLNFWATWCLPCRIEMPSMEELHQHFKGQDFIILAVSLREPAERVKNYFKEFQFSYPPLLDSEGEAARILGVNSIPTTFILDKQGSFVGKALGARKWDTEEALALFEILIHQ